MGGVGSGKSATAAEFAALGCAVIDADAVGHALLAEPDVQAELRTRWGEAIFDAGQVSRTMLGRIVFADANELAALGAILHPRMRQRFKAAIADAAGDPAIPAVVLDAAVLFEAGWNDLCTHTVFVSAPEEARRRRTAGRPGWDAGEWAAREKSQIPLDTKAAKCDYTIDNSSSVSRLREQVRPLFHEVLHAVDRT